ncbi:MAG: TonB-dependent receptor [Mediterranea massiliensis]|nr:TonB-dependent receptor [Mediterranea massiliensis]
MKNSKNSCLFSRMASLQRLFFIALFSALSLGLYAQNKTVSGTVVDGTGESVIGASVLVKGTTNGVITDIDGNFTLNDVPNNGTIQVSYVGYKTQDVSVTGKTVIKVTLQEDTEMLDEVVVVGYGVMKKSDVTGALVSVDSKALTQNVANNAVEALQGKAAGVYITSNERPGEVGSITIRGVNSIKASNSPLVVIDGVVSRSVGLDMLNPQDIESIEVLKDASATAIYGAMGGNGVILVTTKRGKEGSFNLNYSGTLTLENVHDVVEMMNAQEYIEWRRWGYYYAGLGPRADEPTLENDRKLFTAYGDDATAWGNILRGWGLTYDQWAAGQTSTSWDPSKVISTDWTEFTDRTAVTQEHTLSASGGTDKMKAYVSVGYLDQNGTQRGQDFSRYTFRTSVDVKPVKWFSMGGSINVRHSVQLYGIDASNGISSSIPSSIHAKARNIFSYALPYDSEGKRVIYPGGDTTIPTVVDEVGKSANERQRTQFTGSFYAQFDFGKMWKPLEGLTFKTNFGPQLAYSHNYKYLSSESVNRVSQGKDYVSSDASKNFAWTLDNIFNYMRTFGDHSINATLVQSAMSQMNTRLYSMSGDGVAMGLTQKWWGLDPKTVTTLNAPSYNSLTEQAMASYTGRIGYNYKNRYNATFSYRYDGASQLGEGNKWQGFPSAAVAWRISEEAFMEDVEAIESLKLRLGWGKTGNYSVGVYSTKDNLSSMIIPFGNTGTTAYYLPTTLANTEIGWETTDQINIGLDFSLLKGRISGTLDLFKNFTNGLIFNVSLPSVSGVTRTSANVGKTENQGFDLTLNTLNIDTKDFTWSSTLNLSYVKDKIVELQNGKEDMVGDGLFIGQPISVLYGYESAGLWTDSPADMAEMEKFNANGHKFMPGMVKPVDQNGDYKIESNYDRKILGNHRPLWNVGFNNNFRYKDFELGIFIYGNLNFIAQTGEYQGGREPVRKINYYNENNKNAEYQRPYFNTAGGDSFSGILIQKDASYLKVRQISLGYNLPQRIAKSWGLSNVKVTAQMKNPFSIFQGADWMDAEFNSVSYNKGFVFGLNIGF